MNELTDASSDTHQKPTSPESTNVKTAELLELTREEKKCESITAESDNSKTSDSDIDDDDETSSDEEATVNGTKCVTEGIFDDVLTKIRALQKRSFDVDSKKSVFNDVYHVVGELLNLIDEHKYETNYNSAIKKALKLLLKLIANTGIDELFEKDSIFALETLYLYLNLLKLSDIKTYLEHGEINRNSEKFYKKNIFSSLILKVLTSAMVASHFSVQHLQQLSDYNENLLLMLNYVQAEIHNWPMPNYSNVTMSILLFICSYADKTVLVPNLIKVGCVETVLKCLTKVNEYQNRQSSFLQTKKSNRNGINHLINILYNISRHNDGITALNSSQAAALMKQIQNIDSLQNEDDSEKIILIRMTLALRSTLEQIKNDRKHMNDILDHLLQSIYAAGKSEDYCHDGLHISDLLIFLLTLTSYERTLDYLLEHTQVNLSDETESTIQFLIKSFLNFHRDASNDDPLKLLTMTAFCNIIWSMSLRQPCKEEFKKNEEFKKVINEIAEGKEIVESIDYIPKYIENIQKISKRILFSIKEPSTTSGLRALFLVARSISDNNNNRSSRSKYTESNIMISYAEGDNDICTQLYNELAKHNIAFDICIDWKYCNIEFPWRTVYRDMSVPSVILCLFSQKYYESISFCQREFIRGFGSENIIAVFIDHTKTPGWLSREIRKYDGKTIQFDQRQRLDSKKSAELMDMINEYLSLNKTKRRKKSKKEIVLVASVPTEVPTDVQPEESLQSQLNEATNRQSDGLQELKIDEPASNLQKEEKQLNSNDDQSQDSETTDSGTSDSSTTSSEDTSSDEETTTNDDKDIDEGVFSDVLTKIRNLKKRLPNEDSKKSEEDTQKSEEDLKASQEASKKYEEELRKSILNDVYPILVEFLNLIEEQNGEIDSLEVIEKGLKLLLKSTNYTQSYELLKGDPAYALETLYLSLNLLKLAGVKKYLTHGQMNFNIKLFYEKYIISFLILNLIDSAIRNSHCTNKDLQQLSDHNDSLILLLNYVQAEVDSWTMPTWKPKYSKITYSILYCIWNYADKTVLVPNLVKVDCVQVILKWLTKVRTYQGRKPSHFQAQYNKRNAARPLLGIVYNISRHDDGIIVLNSFQAVDLIRQWQSEECLSNYADGNRHCRMILALLCTPDEIKNDRKRINNALDELLEYVVQASKNIDYCKNGLHISEPLIVLVKLINYDRTLDYLLEHTLIDLGDENKSTIQFFIKVFLKFHKDVPDIHPLKQTTDTAFLNILWSVSLRQQYKRELKEISEFIKVIKEIANEKAPDNSLHYVPKYIENIQKAADGIICNISEASTEGEKLLCYGVPRLKNLVLKAHSASVSSNSGNNLKASKPSIMISYSHADNDVCMQLYRELEKRNDDFDIWIDWKYCNIGNLWEKIADGIVNASVVLCLLSEKYFESKSCQQEFFYVFNKLKKNAIPIYIERTKPPNHMELLMCMTKFVRFDQTQLLQPKILKQLMEMINEFLSLNKAKNESPMEEIKPYLPVHYEAPTTPKGKNYDQTSYSISTASTMTTTIPTVDLSQKSIDQWNKTDITIWFQQNKILSELCVLYDFEDGNELLTYALDISTDEKSKSEYQICSQAYSQANHGKILLTHKFARFVNALRKLCNDNQDVKRTTTVTPTTTTHGAMPPTRNRSRIPTKSVTTVK